MKVRSGFVSNSSSSSFIIECKGQKLAEFVQEAYNKIFDLWMELNPKDTGYGLDRDNYHIVTVDEILAHFKDSGMDKDDLKYNKECFEKEAKEGYVFLLGNCASDDGTPEYSIMEMFNDYIIPGLKGRYDWNKEKYERDIDVCFSTRWS